MTLILINWEDLWAKREDVPSIILLEAILKFDPNIHNSFWFLDCFTLRPQIVMPMYTSQDLKFNLNWEYDPGQQKVMKFNDWSEVLCEIRQNNDSYSAF
jgi:hypothetical protein